MIFLIKTILIILSLYTFLSNNINAASYFSLPIDTTQAKEDGKEMFADATKKAEDFVKNVPAILLDSFNAPENQEKFKQLFPKDIGKDIGTYYSGSEEEKKSAAKRIIERANGFVNVLGKEAESQHFYQNLRYLFSPSPWYLARYGFIFGAAVFAGFYGLDFLQQKIKNYLAICKPSYVSPLSSIGLLDQYKNYIKTFLYGLKKQKNDDKAQAIVNQLKNIIVPKDIHDKKQYGNFFIHHTNVFDSQESIRLFGRAAQKLDMDFIAISSVNLLQKNTVLEIANELVQLIYKNNRSVLLYIDQAELLSMDGTEYSEREEAIRILAACLKTSQSIFRSKCIMIGLSYIQEDLQGPFKTIFTHNLIL